MPKDKTTQPTNHILNALLWAAALIGSALMLTGTEHADEVFFLLMVLAITSTLAPANALSCELRHLRRLVRGK